MGRDAEEGKEASYTHIERGGRERGWCVHVHICSSKFVHPDCGGKADMVWNSNSLFL